MPRIDRSARRAELSGVGPARVGHTLGRWPGAHAKFALFGELLFVGLLVLVLAIPVVTAPLALAVGARHLRRFLSAEESSIGDVLTDLRRGILPSLAVGGLALVLAVVLVLDLALAHDGVIPGSVVFVALGWAVAIGASTTLVVAASRWAPERGWRVALAEAAATWATDARGMVFAAVALGLVVLATWQLVPLIVPAIGCLALALLAIPERARRA